ncbi:methyltransferase domain-containing protein [Chroococcidiopsis cubana]|uniref:methyltransferase domain-containing protein n=1 Tax=Chroococcidiopsis cubana TaxID=171392 RepID=UPI002ACEBD75|nr:methyltransferase domain-containing protein [Chroococcidiopsis cubana]
MSWKDLIQLLALQQPAIHNPIAISFGASAGALSRYYLTSWFVQRFGRFLGSYTTFSTYGLDTVTLARNHQIATASLYWLESYQLTVEPVAGFFSSQQSPVTSHSLLTTHFPMTNNKLLRILEPEVMDSWEEAVEYDAMDFVEVNTAFAQTASELCRMDTAKVLDAGTGTARIPIILSQMHPHWQIWGIDLAENMLKLGFQSVKAAGLQERISLEIVDAKRLPYPDDYFDLIISNSLVHHLPNPLPFCKNSNEYCNPKEPFVLDLIRPSDAATIDRLVEGIGTEYSDRQKDLFRDSFTQLLQLMRSNNSSLKPKFRV